jgi:6-phosphogluconolactonase
MIPDQKVVVLDNEKEMADFLIQIWKEISREAIGKKGFWVVALSGGKTPIPFYKELAELKEPLPWDQTHIFLVDERFVPLDDPDSNFRMLETILLRAVRIPLENIHPIPVEKLTPQMAARQYEEDLRSFFQISAGELPEFDLILLGIGEDGHTASLFPDSPALKETVQLAAFVRLDQERHDRITITLPVINRARNVVFLAEGVRKAGVLEKVIHQKDPSLPASAVAPKRGKLIFLLDSEAGSKLSDGPGSWNRGI